MDILGRLFGVDLQASTPGPTDDFYYRPVNAGLMTPAGLRVDEDVAQTLSAWFRGRFILQIVLAMLPFPILKRLPNDGGAEAAVDHPLYDVLHDQPNDAQDSFQWRCEKMGQLIDGGHTYDWIVPGARGFAHQLVPIDPTLVTPQRLAVTLPNGARIAGRKVFDIRDPQTGRTKRYTQEEVFHLHTPSGKGILAHARANLGTALAVENFTASTFGRGTLNGGVIEVPGVLDPEASRRMALSYITAAGDWRLPKVLEQGSTFKESTMSPEDFQMLLSRKQGIDDVARWLGTPRILLENSDPSFGNAEQFWQTFLTIGMGGWLSLFEFGVNAQLILAPKTYFARFTRQAIQRADFAARVAGLVALKNAAIISADEARGVEDMNKRGGRADELVEAQNITGKPTTPAADDPPPPPTRPPREDSRKGRARAIVTESAARVLRKEVAFAEKAALKFAADPQGYASAVEAFYLEHHVLVMATMRLTEPVAKAYVALQRAELLEGLAVAETWTPAYLADLALDTPTPDPLPGLLKAAIEKPSPDVHVPVTIAKGAIQTQTDVHVPPARTRITDIERNTKGQMARFIETPVDKD